MQEIKNWFNCYFDKAENILLLLMMGVISIIIYLFGSIIAPFIASLLLAYILNSLANFLGKVFKVKQSLMMTLLICIFALLIILIYAKLIPLVTEQVTLLISQVPDLYAKFQSYLQTLPSRYPRFITPAIVTHLIDLTTFKVSSADQIGGLLKPSLNSLSSILEWLIYLFLIPIITFLLLKDRKKFAFKLAHLGLSPQGVLLKTFKDSKIILGSYFKGVVSESLIVCVIYVIIFLIFKLNYAILLGIMGGLAVFIPVIGTLLMTIPVVIVGLFQFGLSGSFALLLGLYIAVHLFDAYMLAPWLFGKTLNLPPLVVIMALLIFGGLFGFWGLVLALPLTTFIKIIFSVYREYGRSKTAKEPVYEFC